MPPYRFYAVAKQYLQSTNPLLGRFLTTFKPLFFLRPLRSDGFGGSWQHISSSSASFMRLSHFSHRSFSRIQTNLVCGEVCGKIRGWLFLTTSAPNSFHLLGPAP